MLKPDACIECVGIIPVQVSRHGQALAICVARELFNRCHERAPDTESPRVPLYHERGELSDISLPIDD
jgi:hypothetical protein